MLKVGSIAVAAWAKAWNASLFSKGPVAVFDEGA